MSFEDPRGRGTREFGLKSLGMPPLRHVGRLHPGDNDGDVGLVWSTVEEGERDRQGEERPGGSSRQHRQRARHPHQTGETSCLLALSLSPFDPSALINSKITHLTSIRGRGSPGSSSRIIRRRRGTGFNCHSLRRSLLLCPSVRVQSRLVFVFLSSDGSGVLEEEEAKKREQRMKGRGTLTHSGLL